MKQYKKAFSIIELIFVISIIGIIITVAMPKLTKSRNGAIVTTIKQDINTITTAIESYYMLNNGINNIEDSVKIDKNIWSISSKEVRYLTDDKTNLCVSIKVENSKLILDINEANQNKICQKLMQKGVTDMTQDLL
jgi:general secretion pathway protein G